MVDLGHGQAGPHYEKAMWRLLQFLKTSISEPVLTEEAAKRLVEEVFSADTEEESKRDLGYLLLAVSRFASLSAANVAGIPEGMKVIPKVALIRGLKGLSVPLMQEAEEARGVLRVSPRQLSKRDALGAPRTTEQAFGLPSDSRAVLGVLDGLCTLSGRHGDCPERAFSRTKESALGGLLICLLCRYC